MKNIAPWYLFDTNPCALYYTFSRQIVHFRKGKECNQKQVCSQQLHFNMLSVSFLLSQATDSDVDLFLNAESAWKKIEANVRHNKTTVIGIATIFWPYTEKYVETYLWSSVNILFIAASSASLRGKHLCRIRSLCEQWGLNDLNNMAGVTLDWQEYG